MSLAMNRRFSSLSSSIRSTGTRITALDVWAFVLPASSFIQFQFIGRLILAEIFALILLPWLLRARERLHAPKWLFVLWAVWLGSQIVTDLVVGSAFVDWARGWAAITFTLVNLLAILSLAATPRRARIFAAGLAAGGLLAVVFAPTANAVADPWKFGMAGAVALLIAAATSGPRVARWPWIAIPAFAALGVVNVLLVYRSMGGITFLTAVYLLVLVIAAKLPALTPRPRVRSIVGLVSYVAVGVAVYFTLNAAISANLFGEGARARNEAQSGVVVPSPSGVVAPSDQSVPSGTDTPSASPSGITTPVSNALGPIVGGRAEFLASTQAIRDSPILGHGSWARNAKYVEIQRRALIEMGVPGGAPPTDPNLIPTHSYLLGSWVWAGVAGGLFWAAIAVLALRVVATLIGLWIDLAPLFVVVVSWLLWSIAFSPYGNTERLYATFAIATCLLGLRLIGLKQSPQPVTAAA